MSSRDCKENACKPNVPTCIHDWTECCKHCHISILVKQNVEYTNWENECGNSEIFMIEKYSCQV